jgi:hypothetical protein
VETIANHFGAVYWKNKVVYMNCDDAGQSAFWIYFYNNASISCVVVMFLLSAMALISIAKLRLLV